VRHLLERVDARADRLHLVIHGTTLIANSFIERKGARTALLTTRGYRDALETGMQNRYDPYDLFLELPEPLVPRTLRFGIKERVGFDGKEILPLWLEEVEKAAIDISESHVESVAICFLHSFRNPEHEKQAGALLEEKNPGLSISLSSEVAPEIREYQRMSTTVANAYIQPLTQGYLSHLSAELKSLGYQQPLYLMLSSGGITTADVAARHPIRMLESGPAGGVFLTSFLARLLDRPDLISFDMGGTTAKMAYVINGEPSRARSYEVARVARFKMGSGFPVQAPVVEMLEIGAGGGSIAHRDALGLLKVGPESAGADPGPACYGLGGEHPTVTDANLVLGYVSADNFLGGELPLFLDRAEDAIRRRVAEPLKLDLIEAASGIFDVVNQNMVAATKVHVAERGKDPRRASLVAFGGAGPIHAHALARELKLKEVICPLRAGTASALGFLCAPIAFELARSLVTLLQELDWRDLAAVFNDMESQSYTTLKQAGIHAQKVTIKRSIDIRHVGQGHEIEVTIPQGEIDDDYVTGIPALFYDTYQHFYRQAHHDVPIQIITCRVVASGPEPSLELPLLEQDPESAHSAIKGDRPVYFEETHGFVDTMVYDRYLLKAGAAIEGPAVAEERESTVVISPSMSAVVDRYGNLLLHPV
jgi:N-methylhydantoinase A